MLAQRGGLAEVARLHPLIFSPETLKRLGIQGSPDVLSMQGEPPV